jgi:NAD(P)-dependent dehydrogenase (short-subunit alcohol dehydrogenase family)
MTEFKNQRILITGASKGIGRATAVKFARDGAEIIINYNSSQKDGEETLRQVEAAGGKGKIVQGNIGNPNDVNRVWEVACSDGKMPSVLILNAAFQKKATFDNTDIDLLKKTLDVNIVGNFSLAKLFIEAHRKQGTSGNIVVHSSNQGEFVNPTGFAYALTKAALNHMVRHIARAVVKNKIRVNGVVLGWFNTEGERYFYSAEQIEEQAKNSVPMQRAGKPEEAANMAYYLASEQSSYMTGSLVRYDGGFALDPDLST